MNSILGLDFNENFVKNNTISPINSVQDPLTETQMR